MGEGHRDEAPTSIPRIQGQDPGEASRGRSFPGAPRPADEDSELVDRIVAGDPEAFNLLVRKYHGRIFHLVRGILGDWHRSEDVCQEVFTNVFRKLHAFRRDAKFSVWLHRIAVNAALKARRSWKRAMEEALGLAAQLPAETAGRAEGDGAGMVLEASEEVLRLLRPLPGHLRAAVLLREVGGLSYEEMTEVLGCTRGAVEQRLHRAMVLLRKIWKDRLEP